MIARCVRAMPEATRKLVTVREQLALALNRRNGPRGDRAEAIRMLEEIISEHEPNRDFGDFGRCWKDVWDDAGDPDLKAEALDRAINAYSAGFEADPRDYYPGVNLATLLLHRGTDEDQAR